MRENKVKKMSFLNAYKSPKEGMYCTTNEEDNVRKVKMQQKLQRMKEYDRQRKARSQNKNKSVNSTAKKTSKNPSGRKYNFFKKE